MIINGNEIKVIRSKRKSLSLEISDELTVIARVPMRCSDSDVEGFVRRYTAWIENAIEKKRIKNEKYPPLTPSEQAELKRLASETLPGKVEYWSKMTGLTPTGVRITDAEKRFGSCSPRNSLCFSYRLMRYPEEAIDYVVLHEIAHIRHHDHSKHFYAFIASYMPDYKRRVALLRE